MDPQQANQQAMQAIAVLLPMMAMFAIVATVILIIPLWQIARKAGLSGPISLLVLVPGIGLLVALYVIAFMEWRVVPITTVYAAPSVYPPTGYPPQAPPL